MFPYPHITRLLNKHVQYFMCENNSIEKGLDLKVKTHLRLSKSSPTEYVSACLSWR